MDDDLFNDDLLKGIGIWIADGFERKAWLRRARAWVELEVGAIITERLGDDDLDVLDLLMDGDERAIEEELKRNPVGAAFEQDPGYQSIAEMEGDGLEADLAIYHLYLRCGIDVADCTEAALVALADHVMLMDTDDEADW